MGLRVTYQPLHTLQDRDFFCDGRNIALAAMAVVIVYLLATGNPAGDLVWKANTPIRLEPSQLASGVGRRHFDTDPLVIPRKARNLDEFLLELKPALDMRQLVYRPVNLIFNTSHYLTDIPHPSCSGSWLEFGVFTGSTLNLTAEFRERFCGPDSGRVYGFDTFTGLPENWAGGFGAGAFSLNGEFPYVRHNIELVKGLFSDSLPPWMEAQKAGNNGRFPPITYLHIDCDLYAGSKDALELLKDHIVPGCVLIFDELLHYPEYRDHEVKALWEFLESTGRKVEVVGVMGPMSPQRPDEAVDLDVSVHTQMSWEYQSVAFVVL